jgi:hypothetical protein
MKQRRIEWESIGDGWLSVRDPDVPLEMAIRPERVGDRVVIGSLELSADKGVRTGELKSLRLNRYEASMNREPVSDVVEAALRGDAASRVIRRVTVESWRQYDVTVPDTPGERYPDSFYKEVAGAYMALLEQGQSPAPKLADLTGTPVSTVRRWIAECRRREILPKGRKGKAG